MLGGLHPKSGETLKLGIRLAQCRYGQREAQRKSGPLRQDQHICELSQTYENEQTRKGSVKKRERYRECPVRFPNQNTSDKRRAPQHESDHVPNHGGRRPHFMRQIAGQNQIVDIGATVNGMYNRRCGHDQG